jgi:hypothetical protein
MTNGRGRSGPDRVPFAEHPHPGLCPQQADATRQLQSSLRLHPRSTNCVRLCLSATCVDGQESDPHDARWRAASGYRPRPSGSSVSRCEPSNALLLPAANAVQRGWHVGWSEGRGQARDVPDGAFRRRMAAIVRRSVAAAVAPSASGPDKQEARLTAWPSYPPVASRTGPRGRSGTRPPRFRTALHRSPARRTTGTPDRPDTPDTGDRRTSLDRTWPFAGQPLTY